MQDIELIKIKETGHVIQSFPGSPTMPNSQSIEATDSNEEELPGFEE